MTTLDLTSLNWSAESGSNRPPDPEPPVDNQWCRVRVVGPTGAIDVSLPTLRPVAELVAELLTRLLPGAPLAGSGSGWHLHRLGQLALAPAGPLQQACLQDGEVLHLTPRRAPPPARLIEDSLDALAAGAAQAGRWAPGHLIGALCVAVLGCATGSAVLTLATPGGPALPLLMAGGLLLLSLAFRVDNSAGAGDQADRGRLTNEVAALAAVPAWICAGVAAARLGGADAPQLLAASGLATAFGGLAAAACAPGRRSWWGLLVSTGVLVSCGAAPVALGVLTSTGTAAILGTTGLAALAALPHLMVRGATLSPPTFPETQPAGAPEPASTPYEPDDLSHAALVARGRSTRQVLTAISAAGAGAVTVSGAVLATAADRRCTALAVALALALGLRARRSRFAVESLARLVGAVLVLALIAGRQVAANGPAVRWAVLVALVVMVVALLALLHLVVGAQLPGAQRSAGDALRRLGRPRVLRLLNGLEAAVAVTVLPLLAAVLGGYAAAADAGSRL